MPLDMPFNLGPFRVSGEGRLALAQAGASPRFRVTWQGCRVAALLGANAAGEGGLLQLEAELGRVPSTASAAGDAAAVRGAVFAALRGLPTLLPPGWSLALQADHRMVLHASRALALPTTACSLISEIAMFLLALAPYLDLLAELGVEPASGVAAPGTANTWPG
jgi:hypothetical protein